jgi:hypothetical protein
MPAPGTIDRPRPRLDAFHLVFWRALMLQNPGVFVQHGRDIGVVRAQCGFINAKRFAIERFRLAPGLLLRAQQGQHADAVRESSARLKKPAFLVDSGRQNRLRPGSLALAQIEPAQAHLDERDLTAISRRAICRMLPQDRHRLLAEIFRRAELAESGFHRSQPGQYVHKLQAVSARA